MVRLIIGRLLFMAPAALLTVTFLFALFHLIPGDPAVMLAGDNAPRSVVESIRQAYGFDQPLHVQYWRYMAKIFQGDLGISNYTRDPVIDSVIPRLANTAQLAILSMLFAMTISLVFGCVSAMYWNRPLDKIVTILSLLGICTPVFVTGLLGIYFFSIHLGWLPISGMSSWRHFILPVITLGALQAAMLTRMVRSCMVDALGRDYITTARAKGVSEFLVVFKHALRNALLPVITVAGLQFGSLLSGAIIVEKVFARPGLGLTLLDAIGERNYPVVQGCVLVSAGIYVLVNLLVDLAYGLADPRIRRA